MSSKLKRKYIYLNDDLSAATMEIRRTKLDKLKPKRNEDYIAYFLGAKLITLRRPQQRLPVVVTGGNAEQAVAELLSTRHRPPRYLRRLEG